MSYIDRNVKKKKKLYWFKRNILMINKPLRSFFGRCHFCDGEHFKSKDALEVEIWNMPRANILDPDGVGRSFFNWEIHKCSNCGQNGSTTAFHPLK